VAILRTAAIVVAASALSLAFGVGSAGATRTVTIASSVSINANALTFSGKVTSPNSACKQGRRVTLYRKLSSGGHQAMGGFTTGASGKWHVKVSGFAGVSMSRFYAKVKQRSEGTAGTIYVCRAARSRTITP
jgi:hypothetical protein